MSIFLRGVDMPECCCGCPCCYEKADGSCFCTAVKDGEPCDIEDLDQRLPNCPAEDVPELHGRLIDADAIMDLLEKSVQEKNRGCQFYVFRHMLRTAPTIIKAEE